MGFYLLIAFVLFSVGISSLYIYAMVNVDESDVRRWGMHKAVSLYYDDRCGIYEAWLTFIGWGLLCSLLWLPTIIVAAIYGLVYFSGLSLRKIVRRK